MIGGLVGAGLGAAGLSTQGGFMGNAGGMVPGIGGLAGMVFNNSVHCSRFTNNEQGPAQGPNTPVKNYPGMGYGPVGPMGGGLPPTPLASMFGGPQMGQAGGLLGNANFFSDPMTIKRVS